MDGSNIRESPGLGTSWLVVSVESLMTLLKNPQGYLFTVQLQRVMTGVVQFLRMDGLQ